MSTILVLLQLCILNGSPPPTEDTILVLRQTSRRGSDDLSQQYMELYEGFEAGMEALGLAHPVLVVDIHEPEELEPLKGRRFRYVVSLGTNASLIVQKDFQSSPSIFSMVLLPGYYDLDKLSPLPDRGIQGGILALPSAKELIQNIQKVHPEMTKVGILYPDAFKPYVTNLRFAAAPTELQIFAKQVAVKKELNDQFKELLNERIELFLIIPDTRLFGHFYQYIYLTTMKRDIPCIGPSENFIESGAMWGLVSSPYKIGIQTTQMLEKGLRGLKLSIEAPLGNKLLLNQRIADRLNIDFPEHLFEEAKANDRVIE